MNNIRPFKNINTNTLPLANEITEESDNSFETSLFILKPLEISFKVQFFKSMSFNSSYSYTNKNKKNEYNI